MRTMPPIPSVTSTGAYHPVELLHYFDTCSRRSIEPFLMAEALGVDLDRIIYATGPGYHLFEKRAIEFKGMR